MANKKAIKKVTLDDLVQRKLKGNLDKLQVRLYNSSEFGGEIEVKKIPLRKYMSLINDVKNEDMEENLDFMSTLIYECCPIFKDNAKQLMEVYEVSDPLELPLIILNDNMGEMNEICEIINSFYGLDKVKEQIKN